MEVMVTVVQTVFGEKVTEETMTTVAQSIVDRYCNAGHFSREDLKLISENKFEGRP